MDAVAGFNLKRPREIWPKRQVDPRPNSPYFPPALARERIATADRPRWPEVTARQRDAPSGAKAFWDVRRSFRTAECGTRSPDPARRAVGGRRRGSAARGAARA